MSNAYKKIKEHRIKNALSQKALAKKLNVSDKLISKWENNLAVPSVDYLKDMAKIFGVSILELLGEENDIKQKRKKLNENQRIKLLQALIVFASIFIIVGISVLGAYVIVPKINREQYLIEIGKKLENNFSENYYNYTLTTSENGRKTVYYEGAYVDETGVNYQSVDGNGDKVVLKDGIRFFSSNKTKEIYTLETDDVKDVFVALSKEKIDEEFSLKDVKYVRKTNNGFYLEFNKSVLLDGLSSANKSKIKFLSSFSGNVRFEGEALKSMSTSVKIKVDGKEYNLKSELEFIFSKPTLELFDGTIENAYWKEYNFASEEEIVSVFSNGKNSEKLSLSLAKINDFKVFNDKLYYFDGETLIGFSLKNNQKFLNFNVASFYTSSGGIEKPQIVHVYKNRLCFLFKKTLYVINLDTLKLEKTYETVSLNTSSFVGQDNKVLYTAYNSILNLDTLEIADYGRANRDLYYNGKWYYTDGSTIRDIETEQSVYYGTKILGGDGNLVLTATPYFVYEYRNGELVSQTPTNETPYMLTPNHVIIDDSNIYFYNFIVNKENTNIYQKIMSKRNEMYSLNVLAVTSDNIIANVGYSYMVINKYDKYLTPFVTESVIKVYKCDSFEVLQVGDNLYRI